MRYTVGRYNGVDWKLLPATLVFVEHASNRPCYITYIDGRRTGDTFHTQREMKAAIDKGEVVSCDTQ